MPATLRNVLRNALIVVGLFLLDGLAYAGPPQPIMLPAAKIVQAGYTLQPLDEPGWIIGGRTDYQLILGRLGEGVDDSYIIEATLIRVPANQKNTLLQWVKQGEAAASDSPRFGISEYEASDYSGKNTPCVRSYQRAQDKQAKRRSGGSEPMILELIAYTCLLPDNPDVAVHIGFSYRHDNGHADPQLAMKAEQLIQGVSFTPLPPRP